MKARHLLPDWTVNRSQLAMVARLRPVTPESKRAPNAAVVLPCQIFASFTLADRLLMVQQYLKRTLKNPERLFVI